MTATKQKEVRARPLTNWFKSLSNHARYLGYLRTALETGWFTDGKILFRIKDSERLAVMEQTRYKRGFKAAKMINVSKILNQRLSGVQLRYVKTVAAKDDSPALAVMATGGGKEVVLVAMHYATVAHRYPDAAFYINADGDPESPVYVSGRDTVAVLLPYKTEA